MKQKNDLLNKFAEIFAPVTEQELNDLATPVKDKAVQGDALFTPGEWEVNGLKVCTFPNDPMKTIVICQVFGSPSEPENIANARLIAAAPDMYNALKDVIETYNDEYFASENKEMAMKKTIKALKAIINRISKQ